MPEDQARRLELEKELHLQQHRITVLENENLPRRVASLEPVVKRLEDKLDDLGDSVEQGFKEVKEVLHSQKGMQKGAVWAVMALVGFIQLLPLLKTLLKGFFHE